VYAIGWHKSGDLRVGLKGISIMPINVYTGLMGSGKSYECVSSVIIPAIKAGRRVVTNVDGIDSDSIRAYCHEQYQIDLDKLGEVVHCKNDDVSKPDFLPHGVAVDTFCKAGDLICIDEAWRFWGGDCKLLQEHKVFFREHRHYVHEITKVSCDLVLMVQDIGDLHRSLKVVVEVSFRTIKLKSLGLNKSYRVEMWEGWKQVYRSRVAVENKSYKKAIFPLYSSYVGGTGKELQVDKRQNVLSSPKYWILAILTISVMVAGVYSAYNFFSGSKYKKDTPTTSKNGALTAAGTNAAASSGFKVVNPNIPSVSETWRVSGSMRFGDQAYVIISNAAGRIRLEHPSAFQNQGLSTVGNVDGERVMVWSGTAPTSAYIPSDKK
jgi:zona occludens toxin